MQGGIKYHFLSLWYDNLGHIGEIGLMNRVFANSLGDWGSNTRKTSTMMEDEIV